MPSFIKAEFEFGNESRFKDVLHGVRLKIGDFHCRCVGFVGVFGVQQGSDVTRGSKGHRKCPNFSHSLNTRAPTSIRIWSRSRAVITMAF